MDEAKIDKIINQHQGDAGSLIQLLIEIQHENRWLSKEILEKVSKKLKIPLSQVQHVATFYKSLSVNPEARHEIHVCNGTGCHVRGASQLVDKVQNTLGIKPGETDAESKFSLEATTCLGCCAAGPAISVDGKLHRSMTPDKVEDMLKRYE
jgi:NADH-quinone oxidoreductase subunit E